MLYLLLCPPVEDGQVIIHSPEFAGNVLHSELLAILTAQGGQGGLDQEPDGAHMGDGLHLRGSYGGWERQRGRVSMAQSLNTAQSTEMGISACAKGV